VSKLCDDGKPCPEPIPGRGRGDSRCEQNGLCQRLDMDNLPQLHVETGPGNAIRLWVDKKPDGTP
jgi:hypothetical protein